MFVGFVKPPKSRPNYPLLSSLGKRPSTFITVSPALFVLTVQVSVTLVSKRLAHVPTVSAVVRVTSLGSVISTYKFYGISVSALNVNS